MSLKSYRKTEFFILTAFVAAALCASAGPASAIDQYPGDTSIYGANTGSIQPNVLIILDNSGSMSEEIITGVPYDPAVTYAQRSACSGLPCEPNRIYKWNSGERKWVSYINDVSAVTCPTAKSALLSSGTYQGRLRATGTCSGSSGSFALGNYVNWYDVYGGTRSKIDVAKEVLTNLINTTVGVKMGLMIFNTDEGGHIAGVGDSYGYSGYKAYIKDLDSVFSGTITNRTALVNTVSRINPGTWTPLAETLYESMRYYKGGSSYFNSGVSYASPIEYSCQKNYIILITDGMSTQDRNAVLRTICNDGDCDGDGFEPANDPAKTYSSNGSDYLDDMAKYLYDSDLLPDSLTDARTTGKQNVITYTIGFGLAGVPYAERLLQETAYNGGGVYYSASTTGGLSESLRQIFSSIIEDNTSFVAPVLPVSPENRTYSGSRLYMGFFRPKPSVAFWSGNLKKYGLDARGTIVDKNGNPATNADGSIRDNAVSFWSASADGGEVENGGAGSVLLTRSSSRNIYTYTGASSNLIDGSNAFSTANSALTFTLLGVNDDTEKNKLINFVHGLDAYDEDGNGNTSEKRGWIMGDILHSKPLVVNYSRYAASEETNCASNRSIIYVGGNGGMLHAFRDCDGSEAWAFVPQDLLPNLRYMAGVTHSYYVDSSPVSYVYDADRDGNIETADGDRVILVFGERRGGGFYYALDVSNPGSPQYMWRLSATVSPSGVNADYSELAETWSEPVLASVLVNVNGTDRKKVVAFAGAGYDNVAEDANAPLASTTGRGIYAIEIATIGSGGIPSFTTSGHKVWGYTYAQNSAMTRSFPSQLSVVDINGNGYADRVYAPDMAGNMWRFNIGSSSTSAWSGYRVFQSTTDASVRKIFYRPSVTLEIGYELLFFGTGDRAHPTQTSVIDRLYAVKDSGQTSPRTESDLSDATSVATVNVSNTQGWFLRLANSGEKDLANSTVLNKTAYFTTYSPPGDIAVANACSGDNRGTARFYALKYLSAAPAYNYSTANDTGGVFTYTSADRSMVIGSGIPSGMVTVISPTGISAIVGVGGALSKPPISATGGIVPTYWREVR